MASTIEKSLINLNKDLSKLIKDVLNYEDKNLNIKSILESIKFPESLDGFDEKMFNENIEYAFKCIHKFRSKNKKVKVKEFIVEIKKYVLNRINQNTEEEIDKDFFVILDKILNTDLNLKSQEAIGYFITKIFNNEYKYLANIFDIKNNNDNLNIIKNIIISRNLFDDDNLLLSIYVIINLISNNVNNINDDNILTKFLSYDFEKQLIFIVNNTSYLLKYISIINKNNKNTLLNDLLKSHFKYIILYIQNQAFL